MLLQSPPVGQVSLAARSQGSVTLDQNEVVHRLPLDDRLRQLDQNDFLIPVDLLEEEHLENVLVHDLVGVGAAVDLAVVLVQVEGVLAPRDLQRQVRELADHLPGLLAQSSVFDDFVAQHLRRSDLLFRLVSVLLAALLGLLLLLGLVGEEESELAEEVPAPTLDYWLGTYLLDSS